MVMTMINSLCIIIFRKDSVQVSETWKGFILLLLLKFLAAVVPLLVAMAVSNLVEVLKFAGLSSIVLTYLIPSVLQLASQRVCKKTFAKALEPVEEEQDGIENKKSKETSPLVSSTKIDESVLYMTPYSNMFSYWPSAVFFGLFGLALFLVSLPGIIPDKYF